MVSLMLRSSLLALTLLLAQQADAHPVRDQHWALLANQLFPALVDLGAARPADASPLLSGRLARIHACRQEPGCVLHASTWTEADIASLAAAAAKAPTSTWRKSTLADDGAPAQLGRELRGLNGIIQVYGLGTAPRYPLIDGPIDPVDSEHFKAAVRDALWLAEAGENDMATALDPSLTLALALLDVNDGHDAIAFEPLDMGHNGAALSRAQHIDWQRFRYTAIIVPGVGPENQRMPLSARGKLNVRMAAQRYAEGDAPFIILTGAAVHPRGTQFVEAIEMRRALIERFGVPAESIIIEPYARHTTTNLRNVTRRLTALRAPLDKDSLIITNIEQSRYIEGADFSARNLKELGYLPGAIGARLSPIELTFRPSFKSLRIDPADPLDP